MIRHLILMVNMLLISLGINAQNLSHKGSIIVEDNNVSGGGFQSDISITADGDTLYSSADVSGIFKSTDGGLSYVNVNEGLRSPKVASLAITPDNYRFLYAGTGNKGASGGLFRSVNGGDFWEITDAGNTAQFSGNHSASGDPLPSKHPRSNGDLIVVKTGPDSSTYTDDMIIAGTYKNGVRVYTKGGNDAAFAVQDSGFVRAVAYNDAVPNFAYAAIQFDSSYLNGVYEINLSTGQDTLVIPALRPEGVTVLASGNVYAAISKEGIAKYDGSTWSLVNTNLSINDQSLTWSAVTGYLKGMNDVVYAGVNNDGGSPMGTPYSNIWRTKNGGASWDALVFANDNVSHQIHGQSYDWWYSKKGFPQASLGLTKNVVSSIDVAQGPKPLSVFDDIIYVSGRGGIWKSDDGGRNWAPAVHNMQATANNGVAINPNNNIQIAIANTDYLILQTRENFENDSMSRDKPQGAESKTYDIVFDKKLNEIIVGVGDRDTNFPGGGEVFVKSANSLGVNSDSGWDSKDLQLKTSPNNGRVRAVCIGHHNGIMETNQTILAAVENDGVFRYHNGFWKKSSGIEIQATKRSNFVWPNNENSGVVYLIDLSPGNGLFRSMDGGENWTNIWPSMSFNDNDFFNSGYITADDSDESIIYLSVQGHSSSAIKNDHKVYRLKDADTRIFGAPPGHQLGNGIPEDDFITDISLHSNSKVIQRPGPIVFGLDGRLWLTQQQNSINKIYAGLYVMENPTTDISFTELTTNEYRNIAIQPSGVDASNDGYVYVSQSGTGLIKIKYNKTNMELSDACIEVFPDPTSNIYTIIGLLPSYEIEIIDASGAVISTIDNSGTSVSIDINNLPPNASLRISDPNNNLVSIERILKF